MKQETAGQVVMIPPAAKPQTISAKPVPTTAKPQSAPGRNRTGVGTASRKDREAAEAGWQPIPAAPGDPVEIAKVRAVYGREAEAVGTVPQTVQAILIDRLGERLAQERVSARLYEMLLGKLEAGSYPTGAARADTLRRFRDQEARNFRLVWECLETLGADPTVVTPCADLSGVLSMGMIRLLSDPRTTFDQALDAMLVAELADNEGWRLLVILAEAMGRGDSAGTFRSVLAGEERQLEALRAWWVDANLVSAQLS